MAIEGNKLEEISSSAAGAANTGAKPAAGNVPGNGTGWMVLLLARKKKQANENQIAEDDEEDGNEWSI